MDDWLDTVIDTNLLPHYLIRLGIRRQLTQRAQALTFPSLSAALSAKLDFVNELRTLPIAVSTEKANEQHYEVGVGVLEACLGPRMKYSCCLFPKGKETLGEAEVQMMESYVEKAQIRDGMSILDLGCGWGSLTLYLAALYPNSHITAFSNSTRQKSYIDARARAENLTKVTVVTGDIATDPIPSPQTSTIATSDSIQSPPPKYYDRILSIELFEHLKNYGPLLTKVSPLLNPATGKLFIHIFSHRSQPYHFEGDGWMAKHFFTGGTMPSSDLLLYFAGDAGLKCSGHWWINGKHYGQTCEEWLKKLVESKQKVWPHLVETYNRRESGGADGGNHEINGHMNGSGFENKKIPSDESDDTIARRWFARWQVFYLACAELFNYNGGDEWGVTHLLFEPGATSQ